MDMQDIKGQACAKRAAEVAAAGLFHLTLIGPPNSGKNMIADCMPSIGGEPGQVSDVRPCECGYLGHSTMQCHCTLSQVMRHRKQKQYCEVLLKARMIAETTAFRADDRAGENSATVRDRVLAAQQRQKARGGFNRDVPLTDCVVRMDTHAQQLLRQATRRLPLDGLQYDSVVRIAATVADLENSDIVTAAHVAEAVQYQRRK